MTYQERRIFNHCIILFYTTTIHELLIKLEILLNTINAIDFCLE